MDREAWWATVHRVTMSQTRLSDYICMHPSLSIMLFEVHTCCCAPFKGNFIEISFTVKSLLPRKQV